MHLTVDLFSAVTSNRPQVGPVVPIALVLLIVVIVYFVVHRHRRTKEGGEARESSSQELSEQRFTNSAPVPNLLRFPSNPVNDHSEIASGSESVASLPISLAGLTKSYGQRNAVDGLTFSVRPGTICGFIGPNGAGKTTTIRMLLGLIKPTAGTAKVFGYPISEPASYLAGVGAMIEGPAFYPTLSARKNLQVLAHLGGIRSEHVDRCLDQVGLGDRADDLFKSYSFGMKQRLGIAASLLPEPNLLVLDEPTNGLDPTGIREIRHLLRSLTDLGTTVLISSHLLEELQQICDDVVIIRSGQLVFAGPVEELFLDQQTDLVAVPEDPDDVDRLASLCARAGYVAQATGDGRLHVAAPLTWAGQLNRTAMADDITLIELGATKQSLEDVFFELTEEAR